jgi:hypothetical protein
MKNIWRKLFKKNRPLTNQHGPAKKVSVIKDSISRDDNGKWIIDKTEDAFDKVIAELSKELLEETTRIKDNPVPKPVVKKCACEGEGCKCGTAKKTVKPVAKKPASATKAVSKAKVVKPATAKPTPNKPKSK